MAKSQGLRRFFAQAKKTVPIKVGNKLMQFTATQAIRLGSLADRHRNLDTETPANSIEKNRYSLEDAAFRLLVSEEQLLQEAVDGHRVLYVDASDATGRWMCRQTDEQVLQSGTQTLSCGFLAVLQKDVGAVARNGICGASLLELIPPPDLDALELPKATLSALSVWGDAKKVFRLEEPLQIDRTKLYFLAPLTNATN